MSTTSEISVSVLIILIVLLVCVGPVVYVRRSRADKQEDTTDSGNRVLIFTAAVGGGHEAAGRTARAELERAGYTVVMMDGLREMNRIMNWLLIQGYMNQARRKPASMDILFNITSRPVGAAIIRGLTSLLFARQLIGAIRKYQPRLVISTYPLVTAALGHLRKNGRLRVPAIALVADYGVHPLWVDPRVDLHLVASQPSAALVERVGGTASVVRIPVAPGYRDTPTREESRSALGLSAEEFVVLVVGGAWGIGDLGQTTHCVADSGIRTIVVTGNNTALENRLRAEFSDRENVTVFGWREDLPALMAASDCLIQNAGGMTCVEAIEMDLPVLMFDAIPGHGEFNAQTMEQAGVARWARSGEELEELLSAASRGETSLRAPAKEHLAPSFSETAGTLVQDEPQPAVASRSFSFNLHPAGLAATVVIASFIWLAFASPVVRVAARELDVKIPGYAPSPGRISLGLNVDDPQTASSLEALVRQKHVPVTIFANSKSASGLSPASDLTFGVVEEPEKDKLSPWSERRKAENVAAEIQSATGTYPKYFLASPKTYLRALADAPPHTHLVMPEVQDHGKLSPGFLILDLSNLEPQDARQQVLQTLKQVNKEGFDCVPPSRL